MSEQKRNAYYCEECKLYIVTIDADKGVTPMFLRCRATEGCTGTMHSMMYPADPWPPIDGHGVEIPTEPTYEWFKPTLKQARRHGVGMMDHVRRGGLELRKIT